MKSSIKTTAIWIALSMLMLVLWIVGLIIGNILFPSDLMKASNGSGDDGLPIMLLICGLNTAAIMYFIHRTHRWGWHLVFTLALVFFSIQYFMSQIETLWFNDSLKMELNSIWALVAGGAISSTLFSVLAVWTTGNFKKEEQLASKGEMMPFSNTLTMTALMAIVIWPLIYFLAGYFIAWQFEEVRIYYSGSSEKASFLFMMKENIASHLYSFQVLRGILWTLIALLVFRSIKGKWVGKGIVLALLLSIVGCGQLLLPNPIMPEPVRLAHLLETSLSGVVLGMVMAWLFTSTSPKKAVEPLA
ncbi:hypothetical protein RT717_04795 [Imperialibacter roseus]|uniref:Uncharacterized protein n=1 Tax=Imperialibacter roseus TaxID=1324217 RepID=A0ABZ0ITL3_9BACT|nr:hypothetical protein [Imperialibacter roseus]WOK07946.1 hypothetical protein RT717_04795 [Imperialibacter roseus]